MTDPIEKRTRKAAPPYFIYRREVAYADEGNGKIEQENLANIAGPFTELPEANAALKALPAGEYAMGRMKGFTLVEKITVEESPLFE